MRVLGCSESGYYASLVRPSSARHVRHALLTEQIRTIHTASRGVYGARRVHAELTKARGIQVWHGTVEMLMSRAGLKGVGGRPKWRRARLDLISTDLVDRQFAREGLNELWVTDITEHPTREGKVYCTVVLDVCSRRVVDWSIDSSPTAALVTIALGMAIENRRPSAGRSFAPTTESSSVPGPSPPGPRSPACSRRWDRSATASITPSSEASGPACRSSSSTDAAGAPASNWRTRSSSTSRSSTTASAGTPPSAG